MRRLSRAVVVGGLAGIAVFGLALAFTAGDDDPDAGSDSSASVETTTTTLATGGIEVDAPSGYKAIPLPSFDAGIALPDEWEVTRTDAETIASLEGRELDNPDFLPAARRAGAFGAVLYGAGVDADGRVNDVQLRIFGRGRPTTAQELSDFARSVAVKARLREFAISPSTIEGDPAVTVTFDAGTDETPARGTEVLRVDGERIVSVVVTSEAIGEHDALVDAIVGSLVVR